MSLASSSGDRVGSVPGAGAVRAIPWTGAQLVRCAPCTVLKAGTHMWERVCDQPRRHTGQLRGTGDSEQGSIYVELLGLF